MGSHIGCLIRLTDQPFCTAWIQGQLVETDLTNLPDYQGELVVLLPSSHILLTQTQIPSRRRQHILQALPYSLEEQLIEPVENSHFALSAHYKHSQYLDVAVCQHQFMRDNLARLHPLNARCERMLPDVLALPFQAGHWSLLNISGMVLVRTDRQQGFAIEIDLLALYLQQAVQQTDQLPQQIDCYNSQTAQIETALAACVLADIDIQHQSHPQGVMGWFIQSLQNNVTASDMPINLLQQDYQPQSRLANAWQPWRFSAALLGLWLALHLVLNIHGVVQLEQQQQNLQTAIKQLYQRTFPTARKIIYPRLQMQQKLEALQKQGGRQAHFLSLLHQISIALQGLPKPQMQALDYRQQHLDMQLNLQNLQDLEKFKQALQQQGLKVEIRQADSKGQILATRLRISS